MKPQEIAKLQIHLREKFSNNSFRVKIRPDTDDSIEVLLGEEFIGVIYKDEDEGELSYAFHMTILEEDLPEL